MNDTTYHSVTDTIDYITEYFRAHGLKFTSESAHIDEEEYAFRHLGMLITITGQISNFVYNKPVHFTCHTRDSICQFNDQLEDIIGEFNEEAERVCSKPVSFTPSQSETHDDCFGYRIIAVDFDGCICSKGHWPAVGVPIESTICRLREEAAAGSKLILWTCRRDEALKAALDACALWGVPKFDAVNENIPEIVMAYGGKDSRKITASEYWDDKAVLVPEYAQAGESHE